jgi:hypothetical protein
MYTRRAGASERIHARDRTMQDVSAFFTGSAMSATLFGRVFDEEACALEADRATVKPFSRIVG